MRAFMFAIWVALVFLTFMVSDQAKEISQLKADLIHADAQYHNLNQRILKLERPELVRPFHQGVREPVRR